MNNNTLRIIMAQLDCFLGDIEGNTRLIIEQATRARDILNGDAILFPELAITGYPPEDLLLRPKFQAKVKTALEQIRQEIKGIYVIVGHPKKEKGKLFNAASVIYDGKILACYHKQKLPNYSVFDEKRYFRAGNKPCVVDIRGVKCGILICEDLWYTKPIQETAKAGAQVVLGLNASPYHSTKPAQRAAILAKHAKAGKIPVIYVNCVGGQDELVFDGGSIVISDKGEVLQHLPLYQEALEPVELYKKGKAQRLTIKPGNIAELPDEIPGIYQALVLGTRDYIHKNQITGVLVGLSGGIDSALTLAVAVDAIGKEHVHAVMMPSRYTSELSQQGSLSIATALGVKYSIISIESAYETFLESLHDEFKGTQPDVTEENIQARCRAVILMALSNKSGKMLLTTSNKSELAVGYATLYGDMAGGFSILKDVYKMQVYRLAQYRNQISPVIPQAIIERAPSAELKVGQTDQDTLPPYKDLDPIIERYVENDESLEKIVAAGFDKEVVQDVIQRIERNEYKRRQSPPGVRISQRAFGRDWRYPITSGYKQIVE